MQNKKYILKRDNVKMNISSYLLKQADLESNIKILLRRRHLKYINIKPAF